jgi:hypothetical protein
VHNPALTIFKINTYKKHMGEGVTSNSSIISRPIYFVHRDERTVSASPLESAITKTGERAAILSELERRKRIEVGRSPPPQSLKYRARTCRSESERGREEKIMQSMRIIAIPTETAETVRATLRAPVYGFPAHAEVGTDDAPCRHCLRTIKAGGDRRILFVYDRFAGIESLPQPGPVYVHLDACPRYSEDAGFPEELRGSPRTLEAYACGRRLLAQEYVADGKFEPIIEELFARSDVDYLQVNSTTAGCFTFRIERASRQSG